MEAKRKQVRIGRLVARAVPEAVVIYPWPGRSVGNTTWRTELVKLENFSDELRVGVKG
jgi:hypothetical protein